MPGKKRHRATEQHSKRTRPLRPPFASASCAVRLFLSLAAVHRVTAALGSYCALSDTAFVRIHLLFLIFFVSLLFLLLLLCLAAAALHPFPSPGPRRSASRVP